MTSNDQVRMQSKFDIAQILIETTLLAVIYIKTMLDEMSMIMDNHTTQLKGETGDEEDKT